MGSNDLFIYLILSVSMVTFPLLCHHSIRIVNNNVSCFEVIIEKNDASSVL